MEINTQVILQAENYIQKAMEEWWTLPGNAKMGMTKFHFHKK